MKWIFAQCSTRPFKFLVIFVYNFDRSATLNKNGKQFLHLNKANLHPEREHTHAYFGVNTVCLQILIMCITLIFMARSTLQKSGLSFYIVPVLPNNQGLEILHR